MSRKIFIMVALLAEALPAARAQTATSWIAGNGNWFDAAKWTNGVPNSANADAYVDNQPGTNSVVTLTNNITVGRLRIDAGDSVTFDPNSSGLVIISNSAFAGAGELLLNGTFSIPSSAGNGGTGQTMDGTKTLNGSGKLLLGTSAAVRPEITGITNNNATIEGAAFFGRYNNSSYPGTINNTGTINANIPGAPIRFNSAGNSTNTNLIEATNGGLLDFNQADLTNTGALAKIVADGANSVAQFGAVSVVGGTLEAKNGGLLKTLSGAQWKDVTVSGPTSVLSTLLVDGTITNNGVITVPDGSGIWRASNGSVTIAGSGQIVLDAPVNGGPELMNQGIEQWTIQGQTIRGRGSVGYVNALGNEDNITVINHGTFQADFSGQPMLIDVKGFDNQNGGFLRAKDGGILQLRIAGTLKNTGGTLEALSAGRLEATGLTRVEGGLIRNVGGFIPLGNMTIVNPTGAGTNPAVPLDPNGMILEGEVTLGLANSSETAYLVGEIKNTSILRIGSTSTNPGIYARLSIGEAGRPEVALTGGGQVVMGVVRDANGNLVNSGSDISAR
ncbi:MAG TPA: hypothetical protein VF511_09500, partial [Chthoniobacterales bacterium]